MHFQTKSISVQVLTKKSKCSLVYFRTHNMGNANSGRRPLNEELANAHYLWDLVRKEYTVEELKNMSQTERMNLIQRMVVRANLGSTREATAIFNKVFPDKMQFSNAPDFTDVT